MLRSCVIDLGGSWDSHLPLVEFAYNNSYHSSIGMAPFEALYGRKCRTPVCWLEAGEKHFFGPEIVQETADKVKCIRERIKAAQDRQKSYVDKKRRPMEFQVGDRVMLKVSSWKGIIRFGKRGKLSPHFLGPFKVLKRVGLQAYQLELPPELSRIHNTFHVCGRRQRYSPFRVKGRRSEDILIFSSGWDFGDEIIPKLGRIVTPRISFGRFAKMFRGKRRFLWLSIGRTGHAHSFRENARVVRMIQGRGIVLAHGSCTFPSLRAHDLILVKEYTLVLLGARSHVVARTYVFVSSDSNCLAHNSDFGLLSVPPQSLVSLSGGMHWVLRDELGLGAF
ncbi:hypothetical protein L6452_25045 [Arctium lappa]|uniref:Uncharacterized protein n=1 Tax=Arctium lappa TaxID=4217 RepID=A0ACB9ABU6_ARCLA|nr:hypothetical protein L6452_25045 [Arctium lappa]